MENIEKNLELSKESRHCMKVLRLTVDDTLMLTDGKGSFYRAVIAEPHPKYCRVMVVEHLPQAPLWLFWIHLAVAPTKNIDRMEWFLEKATEVGINTEKNCTKYSFLLSLH